MVTKVIRKKYLNNFSFLFILLFFVVSIQCGNNKLPPSFIKRVQEHQKKRGIEVNQETDLERIYTANFINELKHLDFHNLCDSPISDHERKELKLSWLAKSIDNTQTLFGRWALQETLFYPVTDKKVLNERQEIIKILAEDVKLCSEIKKKLVTIRKCQPDLQIHWVANDPLHANTRQLFFSFPYAHHYLNQSKLALDGKVIFEVGKACLSLVTNLCLRGFVLGLVQFTTGVSDELDPVGWIKDGINEPFLDHSPWRTELTSGVPSGPNGEFTFKEYKEAHSKGSLADRYAAFNIGFDRLISFTMPYFGRINWNVGHRLPMPLAAFAALAPTIGKDALMYTYIKSSIDYLKVLNNNTLGLRNNMLAVAALLRSSKAIAHACLQNNQLRQTAFGKQIENAFNAENQSEKLKELIDLLCTATFDDLQTKVFYSRGRMLFAYNLLQEVKSELIPLLQLIGQIDLYANISSYVLPQADSKQWTFVNFVEAQKPIFQFVNFEAPVYKNSAANSLYIGSQNLTKILITGPNMGGKSAFIRLLIGQGVVLAQSLGIVPATSVSMTIIDGLSTSIDPKEDMIKGDSTFYAGKKSIESLYKQLSNFDLTKKYIMLIDEPFSGTVNDETARLSGDLCTRVGCYDNLIVVIATHIMPTLTVHEVKQFDQKHVEIVENGNGNFTRTFQVKDGKFEDWFSNPGFRTRYIDWLGDVKTMADKTSIEQSVPQD